MNFPSSKNAIKSGLIRRHRNALLAGALAFGSMGLAAGYAGFAPATPAFAETKATQARMAAHPASFADVVEKVRPAVVSVRVKAKASPQLSDFEGLPFENGHPLERFFKRFGDEFGPNSNRPRTPRGRGPAMTGQGSGFFISKDGYVVTNNHVIQRAESVSVVLQGGRELKAKIVGRDEKTDLALLKVDTDEDFSFVKFADKDIRVGDWVVAVGNPFGLGGTVTAGIVSARGREIGAGLYDDFIQIDAPINKGNSGGPAFDLDGNVVGVNTAIFSPSGGSVGIGFAIPAATAKVIIDDLMDDGNVTRGWLGVQIQPVSEDIADSLGLQKPDGALVTEAMPGGPAAKAGIRSGDTVLMVDGKTVKSPRELARRIADLDPGKTVTIQVWRDGKTRDISVKLGTMKRQSASADNAPGSADADVETMLGLKLAPGGDDGGVSIAAVDPGGVAASKGLRRGDVILEVANAPVTDPADVDDQVAAARDAGRKAVLMRVQSQRGTRYVALPLDKG